MILTAARFQAERERIHHEALNRTDWIERTAYIQQLVLDLAKAIAGLNTIVKPTATLAAMREHPAVFQYGDHGALIVTQAAAQFSENPRLVRAFKELVDALAETIAPINKNLVRKRGHQPQPWIAPAMRELRAAGVSKVQADALLRAMRLKGKDAAKAARQTTPIR
jgi:hypothetical protein